MSYFIKDNANWFYRFRVMIKFEKKNVKLYYTVLLLDDRLALTFIDLKIYALTSAIKLLQPHQPQEFFKSLNHRTILKIRE